jgi:hypothetical protein
MRSAGLLLLTCGLALPQTTAVFFDGFEGVLGKQWRLGINDERDPLRQKGPQAVADAGLIRIVDEPVRSGGHAVRFDVPRRLGSFRSELALSPVPLFSDYWYGFSIFIPADWIDDPQDGDIVAQWHGSFGEDKKQFKVEGDGKGRPPVALSLHGDHWELAINWSSAVVKSAEDWKNYGSKRGKSELGKFRKGAGRTGCFTCIGPTRTMGWWRSGRTAGRWSAAKVQIVTTTPTDRISRLASIIRRGRISKLNRSMRRKWSFRTR